MRISGRNTLIPLRVTGADLANPTKKPGTTAFVHSSSYASRLLTLLLGLDSEYQNYLRDSSYSVSGTSVRPLPRPNQSQ